MSDKELTGWFRGDLKPARAGVYQCRGGVTGHAITYQHWDGEKWGMWEPTTALAYTYRRGRSRRQNPQWRGLASDPSKP